MKKLEYFLLSVLVLLALTLRLYKIDRPLADWHSWRQADTAAVARNFIKEGFTPLIPKFDDMSSQANSLDNPNRYRFVEFPIYNAIVAGIWAVTGVQTLYARLTTVVISLVSTVLLYFLVRHFSGRKTAYLASFFFAIIPYNIFYSSAVLPGPFMVCAVVALYLAFIKWLRQEKFYWLVLALIFSNIAILSWPIALFFMIPLLYLAFDKYKLKLLKRIDLWLFLILSLLPFVTWRLWMTKFPEGIPNFYFLINEDNIRFKGAFVRWIIAERLGKLILTAGGFALLVLGLVLKPSNKEKLFYYSMLTAAVAYVIFFASGNVRHDYYQVPLIPILAIFMAKATKALLFPDPSFFSKILSQLTAIVLIGLVVALGYFEVKGFYWINKPEIVEAGQAVDRLLPTNATIVAPYTGDAAFLYHTNRYGYPITDRPLEKFIEQGTKYLVSVEPNDAGIANLARNCKVLEQTESYVIIEMFKSCIGKI